MIGPEWLYHPLGVCQGAHAQVIACQSYNFWSGISGSFLSGFVTNFVTLPIGVWLLYKRHQCKYPWCARLGHTDPVHGYPTCHVHHDYDPRVQSYESGRPA